MVVMERAFLLMVWRNFVKRRSERISLAPTPAMQLGLAVEPLSWVQVFARRLFPGRVVAPEGWGMVYRREWITPVIGRNRAHQLVNAF